MSASGLLAEVEEQARREAKAALRQANLKAMEKRPEESAKLDANLKKNSTFIKKLKETSDKAREPLLKELATLKIGKYLDEVVQAMLEAKLKTAADIDAAVALCSALHQRYADFAPKMLAGLRAQATVKGEAQRPSLRLLAELLLVAVYNEQKVLYEAMREVFVNEKDVIGTVALALTFSKAVSVELLGIASRKGTSSDGANFGLTREKQDAFASIMRTFYDNAAAKLVKEHVHVRRIENDIHSQENSRGDASADTRAKYETALKAYEKFSSAVQSLAEVLEMKIPELPEDDKTTRIAASTGIVLVTPVGSSGEEASSETSLYDNEDTRAFYENLIDILVLVPAVLNGGGGSSPVPAPAPAAATAAAAAIPATPEPAPEAAPPVHDLTKEDVAELSIAGAQGTEDKASSASSTASSASSSSGTDSKSAQLDELLQRILANANREAMDRAALDFAVLNNKNSRKRLIKQLTSLNKVRLDNIPYYARLVATLSTCLTEIGTSIVGILEEEFRILFGKKETVALETRCKNVRFLGELVKFKVCPVGIVFSTIKTLLDDYSPSSVELLCLLLETSGRFLYRTPATQVRMSNMLDIAMKKKTALHLDSRLSMMVENAFFACNPPNQSARHVKERPALHDYVRKLLFTDLSKTTAPTVLEKLRKLPWQDPVMGGYLLRRFVKVWKYKYSIIDLLAYLVGGLKRTHDDFRVAVVDCVLEELRVGLEENDYRQNQRRIAIVRYLGELYNYRSVEASVIFDVLHLILRFGHEGGRAQLGHECPIDLPDDYFRIRLVCTLLDTCGDCFDEKKDAVKVDAFLIYLQRYVLTKVNIPMEIDFMLADTLELLRPKLVFVKDYELACNEVDRIEREVMEQLKAGKAALSAAEQDTSEEQDEDDVGSRRRQFMGSDDEEGEEDDDDDDQPDDEMDAPIDEESELSSPAVDDVDDSVQLLAAQAQAAEQSIEDEEFEAELKKLMIESLEQRRTEPTNRNVELPSTVSILGKTERKAPEVDGKGNIVFKLLTRKGAKQQSKALFVPSDSALGEHALTATSDLKKEQQDIKKIVLGYEQREEDAVDGYNQPQVAPIQQQPVRQGGGGGGGYYKRPQGQQRSSRR